jgi:membrane-associated phospholipid phosphatase
VVAAGIAAPLVRRRIRLSSPVVLGTAAAAPVALCVAEERSRLRDIATCLLQMWAYIAAYEMPFDDEQAAHRRVHIDYPVAIDRALGAGQVPTLRLQRWIGRPGGITGRDKVLVWAHWMWFFVPHTTLLYILVRHPERFTRAAVHTYATFDLGVVAYWAVPTAPPWYAAQQGHVVEAGEQGVRRMMIEYGEQFWRERWGPLYSLLGGNPLAAMPSLHFATSVMAAHMLAETGPVAGAVGWTYALTLGFALVYLGEHYLIDLIGGLTLTEGIRAFAPRVAPALRLVSRGVQSLEVRAHA